MIAVEPLAFPTLHRSLHAGTRITLPKDEVGTDDPGVGGLWVRSVGTEVFRLCDALVDDVIQVTRGEIARDRTAYTWRPLPLLFISPRFGASYQTLMRLGLI